MEYEKRVHIDVNGRTIEGTITVSLPGVEVHDYLDPDMLLTAVASRQDVYCISSRHDREREIRITVLPQQEAAQPRLPQLRRVA